MTPRGPLVFRPDAPKRALRELAEWTIGPTRSRRLAEGARHLRSGTDRELPRTVKDRAVQDYLPRAIDAIVDRYDPERVILFGSHAHGTATRDSDVDLLIVFDEAVDRRERQIEIRRLLGDAPFPKDVLVASSADLPNAARGTALSEAAHDGLVVYER
jgi:predicted nucleotidyltransferase